MGENILVLGKQKYFDTIGGDLENECVCYEMEIL